MGHPYGWPHELGGDVIHVITMVRSVLAALKDDPKRLASHARVQADALDSFFRGHAFDNEQIGQITAKIIATGFPQNIEDALLKMATSSGSRQEHDKANPKFQDSQTL